MAEVPYDGLQFSGRVGETVFIKPINLIFDGHEARTELPEFFARLRGTTDHRSLVILSALVLENTLDVILGCLMPDFKIIQDTTLSSKIGILAALRLIPVHLTDCADLVRSVRNDFAHQLELETLAHLKVSRTARIAQLCRVIKGSKFDASKVDIQEQYWEVAFYSICGMRLYSDNVILLRSVISNPSFIAQVQKEAEARDFELLKTITPVETENDL